MKHFTLPLPLSVNRTYKIFRSRMYKSSEAKQYTNAIQLLLCREKPLDGNVELSVKFYFPSTAGDCDNRLKLLLDSLQGRLFVNDRQVKRMTIEVFKDAKNPRVDIAICPLSTPRHPLTPQNSQI